MAEIRNESQWVMQIIRRGAGVWGTLIMVSGAGSGGDNSLFAGSGQSQVESSQRKTMPRRKTVSEIMIAPEPSVCNTAEHTQHSRRQ